MSLIYTNSTVYAAASFGGWVVPYGDVFNVQLWNSKGLASDEIDQFEYNQLTDEYSDNGLWICRYSYGTQMRTYSCIAFGISGIPGSSSIVDAELEFTIAYTSTTVPVTVELFKLLRNVTSAATLSTYNGTNGWSMVGLVSGIDYDATPIGSAIISTSAYAGNKITFNITEAVDDAFRREDKIVRFLLKPKESELQAYIAAKSRIILYTGYQSTKVIDSWGGFYDTYYPRYGNNSSDIPNITVEYNIPISILTSDGGSLTQSSQVITTGDGFHTIGYYISGIFGDDQKYFVRNNTEAIASDVCIWCDWAKATVPVFTGGGTATMSYVTCQNGDPGNGSPDSQLWRLVCLTGGTSSQWSVEMDNGTYADTGTSTWSAASPSTLTCSSTTGVYTSTANTQGISFTLTATAPQVSDEFTWGTYANTAIVGANAASEPMLMIAPDISGGVGTYTNVQPLHTTVSTSAVSGATQLEVEDETIFSTDDNVVIHNLLTNVKVYNTIASTVTGGIVNLTGGVPWDVLPGFQVYQAPLSVGTLDPITWYNNNYYRAFWLAVDTPAGAGTGIYMSRVQVTEGP